MAAWGAGNLSRLKEAAPLSESQFLEFVLQAEEKELPGKILLYCQESGQKPSQVVQMLKECGALD